jgi:UDP-N-acetylglucosamine 2-epimerase (non-hydrolysing)
MRETTERPEALEAKTVVLVGTDRKKIVGEVERLLGGGDRPVNVRNPYGDGRAAERIRERLRAMVQE